jgi:hypothetical protein
MVMVEVPELYYVVFCRWTDVNNVSSEEGFESVNGILFLSIIINIEDGAFSKWAG